MIAFLFQLNFLYKHLLIRDVSPTDDVAHLLELVDQNYRAAIVEIQNSEEYKTKVRFFYIFIKLFSFNISFSLDNGGFQETIHLVEILL